MSMSMDKWITSNGVKVGDLVRFKDISSGSRHGSGLFRHLNGKLGIIIELGTSPSGNPMGTFLAGAVKETFNVRYFELANG